MEPEKTISTRLVYDGHLIRVRVDEVALANGRTSTREIVEHPGAVAIVAVNDQREIALVRQYRKAIEAMTLEIPAGTLRHGEDPTVCAARELKEETGYVAKELRKICAFYSSVGFCTELMHLYLARGLLPGAASNEDDEAIEVVMMPLAQTMGMIDNRSITDAKTVAGILWAHRLFGEPAIGQADGTRLP